jgi:hypothetical protein
LSGVNAPKNALLLPPPGNCCCDPLTITNSPFGHV